MATPFAQTIVRDTFTRANSGTLGANWTSLSDATDTQVLGITSNAAQVQATGGRAASFYSASGSHFQTSQYSQVIMSTSGLGVSTHLGGPTVLGSATGYYAFTVNMANVASNCSIFKVVSGTFTAVGSTATLTYVSGSLCRLEVTSVGNVHTLTAYVNGVLILTTSDTDASLAAGAPGITGFYASGSQTTLLTNWEGGSLLFTRQGTVIPIGANGGTEEPSVRYEAGAVILSPNADGKIWKLWETDGWTTTTIYYWESADGVTFTTYGSNPVITAGAPWAAHGFTFKFGTTYYSLVTPDNTNTSFDLWQSANGVTGWSKTNTGVLAIGGVGTWDHGSIFNPYVWLQGSTYYMLYTGRATVNYSVGLATSPDLVTWTKYVSNPVIADGGANGASPANGKNVVLNGGNYYMWGFGVASGGTNLPTEHRLWNSADLHTWTACSKNPVYLRVLSNEGANLATGQVADPCMVELNGTTYMYYDTTDLQSSGKIHINMASAPFTMLQIMGMVFGTWIIAGNCGVPGATVTATGTATVAVTADVNGNYVIPITTAGAYTITPSGGTFTPSSSSQTVSTSDITGVNFTSLVGNAGSLSLRRRKRRDVIS